MNRWCPHNCSQRWNGICTDRFPKGQNEDLSFDADQLDNVVTEVIGRVVGQRRKRQNWWPIWWWRGLISFVADFKLLRSLQWHCSSFYARTAHQNVVDPKTVPKICLPPVERRLQLTRRILRFILGSLESAAEAKRKSGTDLAVHFFAELDDFMDLLTDLRLCYRFGAFVE
uniref:Uncharacterized protein n=1 Tax=Globodera rostochiensis TaxID=31243 RepID=A0A914HM01_GLORO